MANAGTTILKYTLLPGIIPRVFSLFKNGFFLTAYLIAVIYSNVRLLPKTHPYTNPDNIGRFGLRHVLAAAANNLVFTRKNIDQIIVFFTILSGLVLLFAQIVLVIIALIASKPVIAGGGTPAPLPAFNWTTIVVTPNNAFGSPPPAQDIAMILMDRVFGTQGIFNSCIDGGICQTYNKQGVANAEPSGAYPWPFHLALHQMLAFYSSGVFLVGIMVILYFITTIVLETAQSGTPFGQRFNKAWVPIRLIMFFALIIPLHNNTRNEGLNLAQLGTFVVAKYGSNMATNAWSLFNTGGSGTGPTSGGLSNSYLSQNQDMVARPHVSMESITPVLQFMHVAHTCRATYHLHGGGEIEAYIVRSEEPTGYTLPSGNAPPISPPPSPTPYATLLSGASYTQALEFSLMGNITVRFGTQGNIDPATGVLDEKYVAHKGGIMPYCGSLTIPVTSIGEPGADTVQDQYYEMVKTLWTDQTMIDTAKCIVQKTTQAGQADGAGAECTDDDNKAYAEGLVQQYVPTLNAAIQQGLTDQAASGAFDIPPEVLARGWGGAAIWYNKIAEMNGAITAAIRNVPKADKLPMLMRHAQNSNRMSQQDMGTANQFSQAVMALNNSDSLVMADLTDSEREMLVPMREAFEFWSDPSSNAFQSGETTTTGNIVIDTINNIFGTSGLFDMRNNTDVHPLAQLSALGKGILEAAVRNAGYATFLTAGAAIFSQGELSFVGQLAKGMASFLFATVMASIAIGAVLYFVLPFMPFIYFMFAVSGWVKSIFEAIVAMPLWALAHLRIDGEGLPGPGATQGYFLLLEIFLRPTLIVFGLLASISIFAALVNVLNQVFDVVVANAGGYNAEMEGQIAAGTAPAGTNSNLAFGRAPLDEFFYTAMYAIICYMMGLACFKLVDQIPNNILRWMGVSVSTFQESAGDPAGQLSSNVYRGVQLTANQTQQSIQGVSSNMTSNIPLMMG
jgi:conjugal transfer/type IV secretion protein DotA/TraY